MKFADHLRWAYRQCPNSMKKILSFPLVFVPSKYRFGSSFTKCIEAIKRSENDLSYVRSRIESEIKEVIERSVNSSSYYRKLCEQISCDGYDNLASIEQLIEFLRRFPVLKASTLRANAEEFYARSPALVDIGTTSGSSGKPLRFLLDRDRSAREWAYVCSIWSKIGYHVDSKRVVIRGVEIKNVDSRPWEYDRVMRELRLSPYHLNNKHMGEFIELMNKYRIDYIHGYPSSITILASYILNNKVKVPKSLKGILPISEYLYPHQREIIAQAFGLPILMFYGLSEKVAIAGECLDKPGVYVFEPLYGYTELVDDDGAPVSEMGGTGRIVSTGFINKAMCLLRYDTGDTAELVESACEKNFYRLKVKNIKSRWAQDYILSKDYVPIYMSSLNIHSPIYSVADEFQFFQTKPGEATIRIVPANGTTDAEISEFVRAFQDKVGNGVTFTASVVRELETNRGKRPFIIRTVKEY